jgi:hypothetical protein
MKPFHKLNDLSAEDFQRETGLSKENIQCLIEKVGHFIETQKERFPEKKRGKNTSKIALEDRILLTLYYLRHYPTFVIILPLQI